MLCLFFAPFISFKYAFHVDAEKMIVQTLKCKEISASMVLKKNMARYLFRREELPTFVGYGQLNKGLSLHPGSFYVKKDPD